MLPKRAANRSVSSSTRKIPAWAASQRFNARSATASSTGCTSLGEAEITCRISLIASCCSNASARRCLSCRSVELSTFRDFLVTVGRASTLAFADFAPRSTRPSLPHPGATTAQRSTIAYAAVLRRHHRTAGVGRSATLPRSSQTDRCSVQGTGHSTAINSIEPWTTESPRPLAAAATAGS